jgi:hypothetical protein
MQPVRALQSTGKSKACFTWHYAFVKNSLGCVVYKRQLDFKHGCPSGCDTSKLLSDGLKNKLYYDGFQKMLYHYSHQISPMVLIRDHRAFLVWKLVQECDTINSAKENCQVCKFRRYNMEREYPQKMFWLFVLTNFLFHFFYLSVPGIILCIVGIWIKTCLYIGCAVLGLNLILSIVEQSRIRNAAVSHSENPEFNELMDAFCSPDGLQAVGKVLDEKIKSTPDDESEKGKDQ